MRLSVRIDDELLAEAKRLASETQQPLAAVIEDALRQRLARCNAAPDTEGNRLLTDGGAGLRPGVCLDDNAALRAAMEERPHGTR
jgi:hypothetical protein